jgi:prepilin-type N-terminal cleavage/methylation domain-containing protein
MRQKSQTHRGQSREAGFTLVELLIVIAIIVLLMSLTFGAAILVMGYQRQSNTETTIRTLYSALDHQWKAVIEAADKERIPANVVSMASAGNFNDAKRARVIWRKLRLRQAFPMNYSEALYPWYVPGTGAPLTFSDLPPLKTFGTTSQDPQHPADWATVGVLRASGIYIPAPNVNETATASLTIPASTMTASTICWPASSAQFFPASCWEAESSSCLLLAVSGGQSGSSRLTNDQLPPSSLVTLAPNFSMVVDAWGLPIVFYRWPTSDYFTNYATTYANGSRWELDAMDPSGSGHQFRDLDDPDGVLMDPAWNNSTNYSSQSGVYWFEQYCYPVHVMDPTNGYTPKALYMLPVLASAGKNQRLGLVQPASFGSPFLSDMMTPDSSDVEGANDNIYSYRLR